jgi:flagellar biogenesis protein FliO
MISFARLLAACLVIALVLIALRFVGRAALGSWRAPLADSRRLLGIVESVMLSSAAAVHVVRVAERYYALARGAGHVTLLCEIPAESVERRLRRARE